ncbi:hypothetical protein [Rufibacter hautae]|uniref:Uncharacterized protein n=1 Tax=Rufibacter hautae TaxID=2595005 RepID=A0A5B6TDE5_9BACT|nr:hypothetical protein [Rufibacter hautae]KAA3438489.1 hypothetical protein FOA19_14740 [Rufibacter hautae]
MGRGEPADVPCHAEEAQPEQFALLCVITLEQYFALSSNAVECIAAVLSFIAEEPLEEEGLDYPKNLGAESIGQMELAKKAIQDTAEHGELAAIPYLYAIYLMPERNNLQLAFVQDFPENVVEEVRDLPVSQVLGPAVFSWARFWRRQPSTAQ